MSYIYPSGELKHFELKSELVALGGEDKETFRFAIAWDGEHYFELTENDAGHELYDAWINAHGGTPLPWDNEEPITTDNTNDGNPRTSPQTVAETIVANGNAAGSDVADGNNGEQKIKAAEEIPPAVTATEPPAQSTTDGVADADEPVEPTSTRLQASGDEPNVDSTKEPTGESKAESSVVSDKSKTTGSSTSGTTRKRSAKNSTRRS